MIFGGVIGFNTGDAATWLWNGTSWTSPGVAPRTGPSVRRDALMAEHPPTRKVVLLGGVGPGLMALADAWTWDGSRKTWTQETTPVSPPFSVDRRAMAYDRATGKVVLFAELGLSRRRGPGTVALGSGEPSGQPRAAEVGVDGV